MAAPFPLAYLPQTYSFFALVLVLTLSLMIIFVGSKLIQWLSFALVGLIVAALGTVAGNAYAGQFGALLGFVAGFVVGGASTLVLLPLGLGIGVGLASFAAAQLLVQIPYVPPLVGIVGFAYGFLLTDLLLPAISALQGGLLIFSAGLSAGFPPVEMLIGCLALCAAGAATQVYVVGRAQDLYGQGRVTYRAVTYRSRKLKEEFTDK